MSKFIWSSNSELVADELNTYWIHIYITLDAISNFLLFIENLAAREWPFGNFQKLQKYLETYDIFFH